MTTIQQDAFLPDPIPFPITKVTAAEVEEPGATYLKINQRVFKIRKQGDGYEYRDGTVKELSADGKFAKVHCRRKFAWGAVYREIWVKVTDCILRRRSK